jgi:hypothetical protein
MPFFGIARPHSTALPPDYSQPQRVTAVRRAIYGTTSESQPNKARRALAESTVPDHAIPPPPAQLGPSDDHASPAPPVTAGPLVWRAWAHSVRDLRPAWAAIQTDALLMYAMRLTPAMPPRTLTRPSLRRHACVTLILSSDYVQVPSAASRLPSRTDVTGLLCAERSLAHHPCSGAGEQGPMVPRWRYHSRPHSSVPPTLTPTPRRILRRPPKSGPTGPATSTRSGLGRSAFASKRLRAPMRNVPTTERANSPSCTSMTAQPRMR